MFELCMMVGRYVAARRRHRHPYGHDAGVLGIWFFLTVMIGLPIAAVLIGCMLGILPPDPRLNHD